MDVGLFAKPSNLSVGNKEDCMRKKSLRLRRKLFVYIAVGLLALTVSLSVSTMLPTYNRLVAAEDNNIYHAAQTRAMAINEWVKRSKDVTLQITSRTRIRQELEKYNDGKISLAQLKAFTEPKLEDAMHISKDILGITRLDRKRHIVASCGLSLPKDKWPQLILRAESMITFTPILSRYDSVVIIGAPIMNRAGKLLGTDFVFVDPSRLKNISQNYKGLGKTSEIVLGYASCKQICTVFPFKVENKQFSTVAALDGSLQLFLQNAINGKDGIEHVGKTVVAYAPVAGSPLGLLIVQSEEELYSDLHSKLIVLSLFSFLIYLVFLFGFWYAMKPLAGRIQMRTSELKATISDRTLHLQKEISERKQAEEALRLNEMRLETQWQLSQMTKKSLKEIMDFALEQGVGLTNSQIGYLAFMNENETVLTMHSWSKQAMKECGIKDKPFLFHVDKTGLWGEAIRQRKPIITNDYDQSPLKQGYPEGHVAITRHMNVPVFDGDKIVVVAGVGNKEMPYDDGDVRQLTMLMQGMWTIVKRERAEEALRESEEKLSRSQKMESLGLLAGGVAHDLNNILSGIVSYPELLLMKLPEDSELRKPLETILSSGNKATAIVQDLLTTARGVASSKSPLNINNVVEEYLTSPEYNKLNHYHPGVEFSTGLDGDLMNIDGSLIHIRKVVMNLASNAAEAIHGRGVVTISTRNCYVDLPIKGYEHVNIGEYAVLQISDNGPGISQDDLKRIFEPFYSKKVMGRSGTGLGLAVVWNVLQDHKGYIDVRSDENGTTFELYFPITRNEMWKKDSTLSFQQYKGNGEVVLIIDDVESQRDISARMMDILGYKTTAVSCGEEAIGYLKENSADILLLDMIMDPGINGRETYEKIINIHPNQKAIIVSGFAETDEVKATQQLGAGRFVKKPFRIEEIGVALKGELDRTQVREG